MWIFIPLLLRMLVVSAVFGFTEKHLANLNKEVACASVLNSLQAGCEENSELLKRYEIDPLFPLNEQLYMVVAENNARHDVNMSADVSGGTSSSSVFKNQLKTFGAAPSVYLVSQFVADLLADPMMSLREARYAVSSGRRGGRGAEDDADLAQLSCTFEKVAIQGVGRGE